MMWMRTALMLSLSASSAMVCAQNSRPAYPQNSPHSRPQTICPWLTQGSAARALGGDVSVTVSVSSTGEGSCEFRAQHEAVNSLEVRVGKAKLPTCSAEGTKLIGIGNEAVRCRLRSSNSETAEMVSSRVRDVYMTVALTTRGEKAPAKTPDGQGDVLEQIAEQVAGNLY
jgi:hypothetical protein